MQLLTREQDKQLLYKDRTDFSRSIKKRGSNFAGGQIVKGALIFP